MPPDVFMFNYLESLVLFQALYDATVLNAVPFQVSLYSVDGNL